MDRDTVTVEIPDGYKPEALPGKTEIKSSFGSYLAEYSVDGNHLYYVRKMERQNGIYPKDSYSDLVKFYDQIYKADRSRVVLVKTE